MRVYIAADGIHLYDMNLSDGNLTAVDRTQDAKPSFLAIHPNGRFLYGAGKDLSAFTIDANSGRLKLLNRIPQDKEGLCHLVVDRTGSNVLSASYGAGAASVHRIGTDGRLGDCSVRIQHEGSSTHPSRQKEPHPHSINLDANNHFAFVADLGTDEIVVYRFASDRGALAEVENSTASLHPGAGPRHFAFHPNGHFAYVINELDSTVTAFQYHRADGRLETMESTTTLPSGYDDKNYTAEVVVSPNGHFLYGSNRGHDSIVVFAIDSDSGKLSYVEHESTQGKWPRNFCIDPTGKFLLAANQHSDTVVVFHIDEASGKLSPTGCTVEVPGPACIRFLRSMGNSN